MGKTNTEPDKYAEDNEGFIDLHIRIHRDDIYEECIGEDEDLETKRKKFPISKALFREVATIMHDHLSGGDDYYEYLKAAYERATGDD